MNDNKDIDPLSGVETTGHEWDGLKELNNPAPRWWLWVFIITIIWAVGYWVVYPAWPTFSGHTRGVWNWTQYKKLNEEQAEIATRQQDWLEKFRKASFDAIKKDPQLYEFARAGGAVAFKENCSACHGTGAEGRKGYPNLNDDDWLWGGTIEDIYHTLKVGVRSSHADERTSQMPAFGKDGVLKREQISEVTDYIDVLHATAEGRAVEVTGTQVRGAIIYKDNCAACHGNSGEGSRELGAPNLSDAIWLYGSAKEDIMRQVNDPRHGVMPAWESRLNDDTLRQLTVYVHSLGGGE